MTLDQLFANAESKISTILGGTTTLSNPSENWPDPLVQTIGVALAGQQLIDEKINNVFNYYNIANANCACLDTIASLVGEYKRTNKSSKVGVVITGVDGYILPQNTTFLDDLGRSWKTDSKIIINSSVGIGTASSMTYGEFLVDSGKLYLQSPIAEVNIATNTQMLEYGYILESCEQFRNRLLNKFTNAPETELTVLNRLGNEANFVKFISDYPDCNGSCTGSGFVIRGGDDTVLANIIKDYAPLNYMRLVGNTIINLPNCEYVKIIRPCPVGIEINYYATNEIANSEFESAICNSNTSLTNKTFNSIDCLNGITFKTIRATNKTLGCDTPDQLSGCGETITLADLECPCVSDTCNDGIFRNCANLESWEYPIFIGANYLGVDC